MINLRFLEELGVSVVYTSYGQGVFSIALKQKFARRLEAIAKESK